MAGDLLLLAEGCGGSEHSSYQERPDQLEGDEQPKGGQDHGGDGAASAPFPTEANDAHDHRCDAAEELGDEVGNAAQYEKRPVAVGGEGYDGEAQDGGL